MSLGLKRGIVQLEPHDKQWDDRFKAESGDNAFTLTP